MKVKALWGFVGENGRVVHGQEIEVSNEYGHQLIGKGLVKEIPVKEAPKSVKPVAPKETK